MSAREVGGSLREILRRTLSPFPEGKCWRSSVGSGDSILRMAGRRMNRNHVAHQPTSPRRRYLLLTTDSIPHLPSSYPTREERQHYRIVFPPAAAAPSHELLSRAGAAASRPRAASAAPRARATSVAPWPRAASAAPRPHAASVAPRPRAASPVPRAPRPRAASATPRPRAAAPQPHAASGTAGRREWCLDCGGPRATGRRCNRPVLLQKQVAGCCQRGRWT
jgi:hypothetical protein